MVDLILNNAKVYVNKEIVECSIAIDKGKIFKIGKEANMPKAESKVDLKGLLVLPGLIDAHVHLRDEGKAYKEDFYTGTAAAAAGGVTTVLDMPNNNPVTMSAKTLKNRMKIAERKILVNVGFFSEFPKNMKEIREIVTEGAVAFKLFMAEQVGGLNIDDDDALQRAFEIVSKLKVPVAVHAEDKALLEKARSELEGSRRNDIEAFLKAHSEEVEVKAVEHLLTIAKRAGTHLHFCHISTDKGLNAIVAEKNFDMPITCEATPHHLLLTAYDLKKLGTLALTTPPVREKHHSEALWKGILNGCIDTLGSDHAPHTLEEKKAKNVWDVKVGIPGLETMLPLMLTMVKNRKLSIANLISLLAEKPAEIFKLKGKGYIEIGNDADLVVVDLKRSFKIDSSKFHSKAKYSPFDGWNVEGKPVKTFVNGKLVVDEDEVVAEAGSGKIMRGKTS
ncbi:MAG: dihydroorotase family protein [Candidatus Bathyarchaeia archaeon]